MRCYAEAKGKQRDVPFNGLLAFAEAKGGAAIVAVEVQARFLGQGIRPLFAGLSLEDIVMPGRITSAWHRYEALIQAETRRLLLGNIRAPRLLALEQGDSARLQGAAAVVLQRIRAFA